MEILEQLGVALGFASLAGVNLYLTTLVAGLAIRFEWVDLLSKYESLDVIGNEWVIGVAGVLFFIEFFADKIPLVDSMWDVGHTFVRPIGGALLALAALGEMDPAVMVVASLLSGGTSLVTHTAKASTRLLINASPEPVSNIVASVTEDSLVLGGLGIIAVAPVASLFVFLTIVILCVIVITKLSGILLRGLSKLKKKFSRGQTADVS